MSTPVTTHRETVVISQHQQEHFDKQLARLNKKAARYKLPSVKVVSSTPVNYVASHHVDITDNGSVTHITYKPETPSTDPRLPRSKMFHIEIDYPIIAVGNWSVVGLIEPIEGEAQRNSVILFGLPESEAMPLVEKHACADIDCDHCETKRKRNQSFLVKNEDTQDIKQVGNTCVEDYTGIDPKSALFLASLHEVITEFGRDSYDYAGGMSNKAHHGYDPKGLLSDAAFIIEHFGYTSNTMAKEKDMESTLSMVERIGDILRESNGKLRESHDEGEDRRMAFAQQVIDWSQTLAEDNSYKINIKNVLAGAVIYGRHQQALAISAISAYQRDMALRAQREAEPSDHIGTIKEKLLMPLTLQRVITFPSQYGTGYRINAVDADFNKVSWVTSAPPNELCQPDMIGKQFTAEFTVKDHEEFRDEQVTAITRLTYFGEGDLVADILAERNAPNRMVPYLTFRANRLYGASFYENGIHAELALAVKHVSDMLNGAEWENPKVTETLPLNDSLDDPFAHCELGLKKEKTLKNEFNNECYEILIMGDPKKKDQFLDEVSKAFNGLFYTLHSAVVNKNFDMIHDNYTTDTGVSVRYKISNDYLRELKLEREAAAAPTPDIT